MNNKRNQFSQSGQSLLELIVVLAVGIVIITALVFSSISSLRNNQLAKNQAQATRLAQEGLEQIRISRDRNSDIVGGKFNDLWSTNYTCPPSGNNCYFIFSSGQLQQASANVTEGFTNADLAPFKRQILIEGSSPEKKFTLVVTWNDFAGLHESRQTTLLRKL